jgi:hypothetical protein
LSLLGLVTLAFLGGAAVMHFKLPTATYLADAFHGAQAWHDQRAAQVATPGPKPVPISRDIDEPTKTFDGFTLYTTKVGSQAMLIDMNGTVVHKWAMPFSKIWSLPRHIRRQVPDEQVHFFACCLYPNGDLLAVLHGQGDTPYGYGLVKMNRQSQVLWSYAANAHHAVDIGDDGTIYALTHEFAYKPPEGLGFLGSPVLVDYLVRLSPEGRELDKIPLIEALRDSPYAALLEMRERGAPHEWDVSHANAVEVLSRERAPQFRRFKAGQVLISLRELDTLAVLDIASRSMVWAARGPWRGQHDPHFLDNGRLLVFDNRGAVGKSRVLEYDPQTQACPWLYAGDEQFQFSTPTEGRCQRLPNGNTLMLASARGLIVEATGDQEVVWSTFCHSEVPFARRYAPNQVKFLEGGNARP